MDIFFLLESETNAIKVGETIDLEERMRRLRQGNSKELFVIGVSREYNGTAKEFLKSYAQFRVAEKQNWYHPKTELLDELWKICPSAKTKFAENSTKYPREQRLPSKEIIPFDDNLGGWYFIQEGNSGPIMFGFSMHVKKDIARLQSGNTDPLCLLCVVDGEYEQGKEIKKRIKSSLLPGRNNWYHNNDLVQEIIKQYKYKETTQNPPSLERNAPPVYTKNIEDLDSTYFDTSKVFDTREKILASIVQRRGQPNFRRELIRAYRNCLISGCNVEETLEAAHITPYMGNETNNLTNGLLLRADLHTLFDLGLITVEPITLKVLVSSKLVGTEYEKYAGKELLITNTRLKPSDEALARHKLQAKL